MKTEAEIRELRDWLAADLARYPNDLGAEATSAVVCVLEWVLGTSNPEDALAWATTIDLLRSRQVKDATA